MLAPVRWILLAVGTALALAGATWIADADLDARRAAFETDARIVHRLLSQRVVQHDAILDTLAILQPGSTSETAPEQRLPAIYPQVLRVLRQDAATPWPAAEAAALQAGAEASRTAGRAALAGVDFAAGHYTVVRAADPASFALRIDLRTLVPLVEWPLVAASPAYVALLHDGQVRVLHAGAPGDAGTGWRFDFRKHLAADSQPFDVVAELDVGWRELPWWAMLGWVGAVAGGLLVAQALIRQRSERRRAQELLRLGQIGRLNALGELAAGMAHEVNQPLTAVLANANAAERLLAEDPPDLAAARDAVGQAARQARRAGDVVGRLRRAVERPELGARVQPVRLDEAVRHVLDLLAPDCRRLAVTPAVSSPAAGVTVLAEPVALEQIVHNLLTNALQALEQVPPAERRLRLALEVDGPRGVLAVQDSGPGIPAEALPRVFEPFFTTRPGGLGLGLSLCETLATGMMGALSCANAEPRGALFRLALPLGSGATG
ncbi:MAG: two-component sensor histidine kinase [Betaproteobacteria bacterium]|nr:two-component sensor histidine kinase [Betaproteobacteria bacterium]